MATLEPTVKIKCCKCTEVVGYMNESLDKTLLAAMGAAAMNIFCFQCKMRLKQIANLVPPTTPIGPRAA